MRRTLQPELLDSLSPDDPEALQNRRELRRVNFLMGNFGWFITTLKELLQDGERIIELGSGDGSLGRELAATDICVNGLDLCPRPSGWPAEAAWHREDIRQFAQWAEYPVIIGNLIFHQFSAEELAAFGKKISRTSRLIVACEPVRRRRFQWLMGGLNPLLGHGRVTRHDAHVSIAAGFVGDELPRLLGLDEKNWSWRCNTTGRGANRMIARRR